MGLFNKKPDPISERAKALNQKIAALEAEIKKLSEAPPPSPLPPPAPAPVPAPASSANPSAVEAARAVPSASAASSSNPFSTQPRLRSTALPHRQISMDPPAAHEPIFEELNQPQIRGDTEPVPPSPPADLGMRKSDFASLWQRFTRHFRGPMTSNPKLVSYLAAGSIQGLQPLRYEKRVARNRFIVLVVCLALVLWGIIAIFIKR